MSEIRPFWAKCRTCGGVLKGYVDDSAKGNVAHVAILGGPHDAKPKEGTVKFISFELWHQINVPPGAWNTNLT